MSVQIPIVGRALVRAAGEEVVADVCVAAVPDPDAGLDIRSEQRNEQLVVQIDRVALETQLRRLLGRPPEKRLRLAAAMDLTMPAVRSWLNTVHLLRADLDGPGGLRHPALQSHAMNSGELTVLVEALAPLLIAIPGCACRPHPKILGETAGIDRYISKDAYARHNGTGPIRRGHPTGLGTGSLAREIVSSAPPCIASP